MATGPAAGLALVDAIAERGELAGSQLLPSVRAELLVRLRRMDDAHAEYLRAIALSGNATERALLERKAAALTD
jgi:predicted RNA polymerase sigma factor